MSRDVDESVVAEFLLFKKYHLAALELHQELLESNNGVHNVAALNKFFNDPALFESLVLKTDEKARQFQEDRTLGTRPDSWATLLRQYDGRRAMKRFACGETFFQFDN